MTENLSSTLGRGPGRSLLNPPLAQPGTRPGLLLTLDGDCDSTGRQGTAGRGPPDSPMRPGRSPTGPRAGGTTAKAHSPIAAVRKARPERAGPSSPGKSGDTASAWGSTAATPSSGLPWTRTANPSVSRGNNSATQVALASRFLRPAGTGGTTFLSRPFGSVKDRGSPVGSARWASLG